MSLSNLRVWAPEPRYMLAMKCISARWDTSDREDVIFLIKELKLKKPPEVFGILESYYPHNRILPKTKFFIEELFSGCSTAQAILCCYARDYRRFAHGETVVLL